LFNSLSHIHLGVLEELIEHIAQHTELVAIRVNVGVDQFLGDLCNVSVPVPRLALVMRLLSQPRLLLGSDLVVLKVNLSHHYSSSRRK
jgi:hypothetical protein